MVFLLFVFVARNSIQVAMVTAEVALKATAGLDKDTSKYLQTVKDYAYRNLHERTPLRAVQGDLNAGADVERDISPSYENLKKFMDKEERNMDFLKKMKCVSDGNGGVLWVRAANVQRWQDRVSNDISL